MIGYLRPALSQTSITGTTSKHYSLVNTSHNYYCLYCVLAAQATGTTEGPLRLGHVNEAPIVNQINPGM